MKTTRNKVGSHIAEQDSNADAVQPAGTLNPKRSVLLLPSIATSRQNRGHPLVIAAAKPPKTIKGIRRTIRTAATMDSKIRMG